MVIVADQRVEVGQRRRSSRFDTAQPCIFGLAAGENNLDTSDGIFETLGNGSGIGDDGAFVFNRFGGSYKMVYEQQSIATSSLMTI